MTENKIRLTQYSRGAGCGCKIAPEILDKILKSNTSNLAFKNLMVGNETKDDAAVYDLGNGTALISTTDFFMPIVDDAFQFGQIAAANAISDIYAMGGKPLMAVAILGFPVDKLPVEIAQQIIEGGRSICKEAGIPLAGGHSIDSSEPVFGLAVNGLVNTENLKRNCTGKKGDLLFLTKPLGVGIVTSAAKKGVALEADIANAVASMTSLNKAGEHCGKIHGVNSLTDVTGFGLLGHLAEMCEGSGLSAEIYFDALPMLPNLDYYLDKFIYPDMTTKIFSAISGKVNELTAKQLFVTCDPQTSGGLLVAVAPSSLDEFNTVMSPLWPVGIDLKPIGKLISKQENLMRVL